MQFAGQRCPIITYRCLESRYGTNQFDLLIGRTCSPQLLPKHMSAALHWLAPSAVPEKTDMTVQGETLKGNHMMQWYHRHMTTATAQANPNIAFINAYIGKTRLN